MDQAQKPNLKVGFILCPLFPLFSLAGFVEALRHAADRGDRSRKLLCSWTVMTAFGQKVTASCGLQITPDSGLLRPEEFDYLAIVGPLLRELSNVHSDVFANIRRAHEKKVPIIGLCTGSFVLAEAGLMQNRTACIHPYHSQDFKDRYPSVALESESDFIEDGRIITVPGGISVLNYVSHLIDCQFGKPRAVKVAHQMSLPKVAQTSGRLNFSFTRSLAAFDHRLKRAISLMERDMENAGNVANIAEQIGTSERQLERIFKSEMGLSPKEYWLGLRLDYGKWHLLNSNATVTNIAYQTGFSDCSHFIYQFRKRFGTTPGRIQNG